MFCCFENCLQEKRIAEEIDDIEKDTGFKLRVLAQNYPVTPGIMIYIVYAFLYLLDNMVSLN